MYTKFPFALQAFDSKKNIPAGITAIREMPPYSFTVIGSYNKILRRYRVRDGVSLIFFDFRISQIMQPIVCFKRFIYMDNIQPSCHSIASLAKARRNIY